MDLAGEASADNYDDEELCSTTSSEGSEGNSSEMEFDEDETTCLFCSKIFKGVNAAIDHITKEHNVNFRHLKSKFKMDQYSFIKLINYIRAENVSPKDLELIQDVLWDDEKYLRPKDYETWLTYDYDELLELPTNKNNQNNENKKELYTIINSLKTKISEQNMLLELASEDMEKMRTGVKNIFAENDISNDDIRAKKASLKPDDSYFSGYAHFGIHHEMLSDVVRTTTYRDALFKNKEFVKNKAVLDVGCGTSILSIFASQAGAKTVVGVDNSNIIYHAMDIIKKNKIPNVTLIKGRLEDTTLPQEKFDIIISEWMGYFLLFEGMLDSIIYARNKYLKPGGILLPNRCTMSLVGYGSDALFKQHVQFWDNVYGLNMSTMRKEVLHEPLIDIVEAKYILTEPNEIANLNLAVVDLDYSNFSYNLKLKCTKSGKLSAFVGYFTTYFELPVPIMFGTSPADKPTHWKQVVFFLEKPQNIKAGDMVTGCITCKRSSNNTRSLDITIKAFGKTNTYYLD
ncbi:protein arginine N-methyltransferase 1 [Teleopsis dalmanni]|uniref:protein arginine N-methyltransferase 1 n=1 Tax=Teleopsis dalmanni TaxID=139649 RepID=UPI0018CE968E|nr:protein arginine N-methyltransferase 1 [Teleopsis dalmanni]XP_037949028.1 protein arginine N-methyltransferase 1 [Teleopsis dalmanni]